MAFAIKKMKKYANRFFNSQNANQHLCNDLTRMQQGQPFQPIYKSDVAQSASLFVPCWLERILMIASITGMAQTKKRKPFTVRTITLFLPFFPAKWAGCSNFPKIILVLYSMHGFDFFPLPSSSDVGRRCGVAGQEGLHDSLSHTGQRRKSPAEKTWRHQRLAPRPQGTYTSSVYAYIR